MPVLFYDSRPNSNEPGYKIIPAPKASIIRRDLKSDDGIVIGRTYSITLTGKILVNKGSPFYDPETNECEFWDQADYPPDYVVTKEEFLTTILAKQKAMRKLFSVNGRCLEIYGYEEEAPFLRCYPRVLDIDFKEGQDISWADRCDYTIQLEADTILFQGGNLDNQDSDTGVNYPFWEEDFTNPNATELKNVRDYRISKIDESWQIENMEESDQKAFKIVHSMNVAGKKSYDNMDAVDGTPFYEKSAWENAWDYAKDKLLVLSTSQSLPDGIDDLIELNTPIMSTGINPSINQFPYLNYNYSRNFNVNKTAGSISVTENLIKARAVAISGLYDLIVTSDAHAIEKSNIQVSVDEQNKATIRVTGKVTGLEDFYLASGQIYITKTKLENAQKYFDKYVNPNNPSTSLLKGRLDAWLAGYDSDQFCDNQISNKPRSHSISISLKEGIIDYDYSYTSSPNTPSGFKSWDATVTDNYATPHIATVPIMGRPLGPLIFYLGTKTAYKRSLRIQGEAEMNLSNPCASLSNFSPFDQLTPLKAQIESYVTKYVPVGTVVVRESDSESWSAHRGSYSRDITWIYEK